MFPCACSLRSTQCAALIALATAAGIARMEPAFANGGAGETSHPGARLADQRVTTSAGGAFFQYALRVIAPWLRGAGVAASPTAIATIAAKTGAHDPVTSPAAVAAWRPPSNGDPYGVAIRTRFRSIAMTLPAADPDSHLIPFAVGPPRLGSIEHPCAGGTVVPRDSAAHGSPVSRIAPDPFRLIVWPLASGECPSPDVAGTWQPSFAVHGESRPTFPAPTTGRTHALATDRVGRVLQPRFGCTRSHV